MPARAKIVLVLALAVLSGCDYVLGLQRHVDAGVLGDGTNPTIDAPKICFEDYFLGSELDIVVWTYVGNNSRISIGTNAELVFRFLTTTTTLGEAGIRTQSEIELRDTAVLGLLLERPVANTETAMRIVKAGVPVYQIRVTSDSQLHMLVGALEVGTAAAVNNQYLQIRSDGSDVVFGHSVDGVKFIETRVPAATPFGMMQLELSASSTGAITTSSDVVWDRLTVTCPP